MYQSTHTDINYAVTLSLPGDFYEFTVDVVNAGTIDGMVSVVTSKLNDVVIDSEHPVPDYLIYSVKYEDGVEIEESHLLAAGETETYKVRVEFDSEITGDNLPSDTQTLSFNFGVTYVQADNSAVERDNHKLYTVLQKAATEGTYARKYTGEHQDSFAGTGTKDIYHWYGSNNTNGTAILNKNNVIFANHCWQMIRTTDTGGVKMIYNGEVENNQCLNSRGTHIGYDANVISIYLADNYYYGTSYNYDSTNKVFSLSGALTQETWNSSTGPTLVGKYTCRSTSNTGTCSTLYFIESYYNTNSGYVVVINQNSHYSQFGKVNYNLVNNSLSNAGYMYNTSFPIESKHNQYTISNNYSTINTSYYYSDTIEWNTTTPNQYTLLNPVQISSLSGDYGSLVGKYVARNTNYYNVLYIEDVDSNTMYYRELTNGDLTTSLTIGDSYTESGGIYILTGNVTYIPYETWYSTSDFSIYKGKYVCDGNNTNCTIMKHISPDSNPRSYDYVYFDTTTAWSYAESVSYDGTTYTLTGDIKTFWDLYDNTNQNYLSTHHYTCLENGSSCASVGYVYNFSSSYFYYLLLSGVQDIETAINNMLYANDVNTKNSTLKAVVDAWYEKYLSPYDDYIEDTIFCNDRTIRHLGPWDPNGGSITGGYLLSFQENVVSTDLSCDRDTDRFSTLNLSALLTYKVGIMSSPEMNLLNNNKVRTTGQYYWLSSPRYFDKYIPVRNVSDTGTVKQNNLFGSCGVRPSISLKPGIKYVSGDGSMASPYIIDASSTELRLNESSIKFRGTGGTTTLIATTNTQETVTWESEDISIATVNSNGVVTSVGVGTTNITAKVGLLKVSAVVNVLSPFEYDSWDTIINNIHNNNISEYNVGDTKIVELNNSLGTHTLRIANKSMPSECEGSDFSETACGFVLEFADIITTHRMNPQTDGSMVGTGNIGGWPASEMRTYLNDTNDSNNIINSLPAIIKNAIIDTKVVSGHGLTNGEINFTSTDKLYLLSTHEVFTDSDGNINSGIDKYDTAYHNTRQLDYYAGLNVTTSNRSEAMKKNNNSRYWWLRSADVNTTYYFFYVDYDGGCSKTNVHFSEGVSPAFRIG